MKSNNSTLKRVVIFISALLIVIFFAWTWWITSTASVSNSDNKPILFVVHNGDGVRTISANLANQHLIRSPTAFFILVKLMHIERSLQAGDFRLNRVMDAKEIALELTHGYHDAWVTTLEGWRNEEIANRLAKDLDIPESEFLVVAHEGYMFPDTYLIPRNASSSAIAALFLETFNKKVTSQMRRDAESTGLTLDQVITLASIVEREGRTDEDRPIIAGILLKRLKAGWPLQTDATIQYTLGYQENEKSWWKKSLTDDDKKINSPYNTYLNPGLPPGAICNPGLASIRAVMYARETPYWYYLHDNQGIAHYAATIEEHNQNIRQFLEPQ